MLKTVLVSLCSRSVRRGFSLLSFALLCLATTAMAQTWTVNNTGDTGTGSGNSGDLRYAITQANAASGNNSIEFAVTGTISLTSALPQITSNATIIGSGPKVLTISGANSYQVFNIASSATVTINGMTIANGSAGNAGAILNAGALTVENVAFSGNYANVYGGAIWNTGMLTVDGVAFSGNRCGVRGGAIFNSGSGLLKVSNSTFSGNSAFDDGGAIAGVNLTVTNSTFSGNSATYSTGGAIFAQGSTLTVTNSTFSGNSASNQGGGIYAGASTTTVNNSIFTGNYAVTDGGIFNTHTLNGSYNILGADINGECGGTGCLTDGVNGNQVGVPAASIGLLPLGNYGGPTETMALAPGSAAICAGLKADAVDAGSNPLAFDERGFAMDPTCSSSNVDAGAVQTNQYVVNSLIDSGDGSDNCNPIGTGTTCSLRDAIGDESSSGGDITFLPSLTSTSTPGTINLSRGATPAGTGSTLTVSGGNILGPGANQLTVSGDADTSVGSVLTVTSGGQAFLYGLTISGGYSENSPGGGGIYNQGTLTTMASAISGNLTGNGLNGAGIVNSGTLTLTGSTVSGNQILFGSGSGGGIYSTGTLTLNESTVAYNTVPFQSTGGGGGIFVAVGSLTLTGSTVSGNSTAVLCPGGPSCLGGNGGGIYNGGTLTAENSIVAGNTTMGTANSGDCVNCGTPGSSNLIGGAPELSGLQSNGVGATVQTMIPLPGSPAICAGFGGYVPSWIMTDERGFPLYPTGGYCALGVVDSGAVQTNYTGVQFNQQPSNTSMSSVITPAPTVSILETDTLLSANNTDAVNGVPISLTYSDGASNLITGTLTQTTAGGIATYGDLVPGAGPASATLSTSVPVYGSVTLTATSDTFAVVGPAAQLVVSTPGSVTAGASFSFTITAEDALGNPTPSYSGTVHFTSSDTATGVILPADSTLVNGVGTFNATLVTGGSENITATDTTNSGITGTSPVFLVNAAAAAGLQASGYPTTWYAGATAQVFINEVDQYGNFVQSFTGPVTVTTSDSAATLTQLSPYEYGVVAYSVVFNSQGKQSITAAATGLPNASETGISIGPMPSFVVTVSTDTTDGQDTAADCTDQSQPGATPDASCSLRDALWAAGNLGAGNVTFSSSVFYGATTVTLTAPDSTDTYFGSLPLGANVTVTGPTNTDGNLVTISGAAPASPATGSAVFYAYGTPSTLSLVGPDSLVNLNITNGNGTAATGDNSGTGGISSSADLTVTNCSFTGNIGDNAGALFNYSGNVTISGSTFSTNSSTGLGLQPDAGAIFSDTSAGTPRFVKDHPFASRRNGDPLPITEASNSTTKFKSGFYGTPKGGLAGFASRVRPMNAHKLSAECARCATARAGNSSMLTSHLSALPENSGGGAPSSIPTLTVTNTTFTGNSGGATGAIFDASDLVTITNSTFTNNAASNGGGALVAYQGGSVTVSGSTFTGNMGSIAGVAFDIEGGQLEMQGSTLAGNASTGEVGFPVPDAGGIDALESSFAFLAYDTFTNNSSTSRTGVGAIADLGSSGSYVAAFNITVTGNSGFYGAMYDDSSSESDLEDTIASGNLTNDPNAAADLISPDSTGMVQYGGNVITDPNVDLSTLGNYGGPTQTIIPLPGSTAICAGSVADLTNAATNYGVILTTDQRGDPNTNSTYLNPSGTCVDAGAVQTNYAISFTTQPPTSGQTGVALNPAPVVTLTESGTVFTAGPGTIGISDTDADLNGSSTVSVATTSGAASFTSLEFTNAESGDKLIATLALNPAISSTSPAISSVSNPFNVTKSAPPFGWINLLRDAATGGTGAVAQGDSLQVTGVAADPHDGTPVSQVQILIDNTVVGNATLGIASLGLEAFYNNPAYATGGWTFTYPASGLSLGTHTLTVIASDSLGLSATIATRTFTVATASSGPPFGWINLLRDAATGGTGAVAQGDSLQVTGVAADPHDGTPVSQVQILIDNTVVGNATLGIASPSLEALYNNPAYAAGGWTFTYPASGLSLGTHTLTVIASDSLSLSATIATRTFTVATASSGPPFGWINLLRDAATGGTGAVAQGDSLQVTGVAADPHDGTPVSQVQILIDNTVVGNATLGIASLGLEALYNNPAYATGGWTFTYPASGLSLGTHTLTVIASDSLGLSATIASHAFTVATASSGPPFGWINLLRDAATGGTGAVAQGDSLQVTGVAADPHDGTPVSQVQILIDNTVVGNATLGIASLGLEALYNNPAYATGGWTFTYPASGLSLGTHTLTVIASDSLGLSATIATQTFTVTN